MTSELFPVGDYEYSCTNPCMDLGFFFSLLSKYLGMEGLDIMVGVMCNFLNEICQMTFQNDCSI